MFWARGAGRISQVPPCFVTYFGWILMRTFRGIGHFAYPVLYSLLFLVSTPALVTAQNTLPTGSGGAQSYVNDFSRPGQATMLVNVWGSAGQPGLWRVEKNVDLIDFLSVVGVPGIGLEEPGTRSTAYATIYRTVNGERREVFRQKIERLLQDGARYPTLADNDVLAIEIKRRRTIGLQVVSTIIGTASSITLLVLQLTGN